MRELRTLLVLAVLCLVMACSGPSGDADSSGSDAPSTTPVELELVTTGDDAPRLRFLSLKNKTLQVPGTFEALEGTLRLTPADLGTATGRLAIQLGSIETNTARRDRNVREVLFGLLEDATGQATVQVVRLTPETPALRVGETTNATADFALSIRGFTSEWTANVTVTREGASRWVVATAQPVALSMEALGLGYHAKSLKAICMHEELDDSVSITARFVFAPPAP